jgi:HK97 family phage prohead protease
MNRRNTKTEVRMDEGGKTIRGTASVTYDGSPGTEYQLWERTYERIMPGAFDAHLKTEPDVMCRVNHDSNQILARTSAGNLELKADKDGLHYTATPPDTTAARDLKANIQAGNVFGSSFAFEPDGPEGVEWKEEEDRTVRYIRKAKLYDVAPVTDPAYRDTTAYVRGAERTFLEGELETHKRHLRLERIKAKGEYGKVDYADPGLQPDKKPRYPIDTPDHIKAALSYIGQKKNQALYTAAQVQQIKDRIIKAWKAKIDAAGPPSAKED